MQKEERESGLELTQNSTEIMEMMESENMLPIAERESRRASGRWNLLMLMRRVHLYLGMFSAPAILFFAFTGILQTLSLHDFSRDGNYQPASWIVVLAQIHKKQTLKVPERKSAQPPNAKVSERKIPKGIDTPVSSNQHQAMPMKIFFVLIGVGLFFSTVSGMVMAWKFKRDRRVSLGLFIAGTVVPILLLVF